MAKKKSDVQVGILADYVAVLDYCKSKVLDAADDAERMKWNRYSAWLRKQLDEMLDALVDN